MIRLPANWIIKTTFYFSTKAINKMHPYLIKNLKRIGINELHSWQLKSYDLVVKNQYNLLINQPNNAGKTLAYLLPLLSEILYEHQQSKLNEAKDWTGKIIKKTVQGGVILTLNKQLALQIYKLVRSLDGEYRLNISRAGSIAHYSSVIDQMSKPVSEQDEDVISDLMMKNVAKSIKWANLDLLITTPHIFHSILTHKLSSLDMPNLKYIVMDEADLLLMGGDTQMQSYIHKIIKMLRRNCVDREEVTYVIATNYVPEEARKWLEIMFRPLEIVEYTRNSQHLFYQNHHSKKVNLYYIFTDSEDTKQYKLAQMMERYKQQHGIIFCKAKSIQKLKTFLKVKFELQSSQYHNTMSAQKRMSQLHDFQYNFTSLLLATDLGSRGLHFPGLQFVIVYEMSLNIENQINKIGRITHGDVVLFVNQENRQHFNKIVDFNIYSRSFNLTKEFTSFIQWQ